MTATGTILNKIVGLLISVSTAYPLLNVAAICFLLSIIVDKLKDKINEPLINDKALQNCNDVMLLIIKTLKWVTLVSACICLVVELARFIYLLVC